MKTKTETKHTPGPLWPKVKRQDFDAMAGKYKTTIITREEAALVVGADSIEQLIRGVTVGVSNMGPNEPYFTRYTLEDSIRDAAPDLLEAAQLMASELRGEEHDEKCSAFAALLAAIAKAEGR